MKKCNKCNIELWEWHTLKGQGKSDLIICGTCFDKDKPTYWKEYSYIAKDNNSTGQEIKFCGHVGDECYNCDVCKKIVEVKPQEQPTDTHYRFCFSCDKWLNKQEVNKVDWGEQPGGGNGECWHCKYCRKQLGDDSQIQIFRCKKHPDEILKVWGTLDGVNKEKVFYQQCPQEGQEHQPKKPNKSDGMSGGAIAAIVIIIVVILGGGFGLWYWKRWKETKSDEEDLL